MSVGRRHEGKTCCYWGYRGSLQVAPTAVCNGAIAVQIIALIQSRVSESNQFQNFISYHIANLFEQKPVSSNHLLAIFQPMSH
jgi:hypothetical protein